MATNVWAQTSETSGELPSEELSFKLMREACGFLGYTAPSYLPPISMKSGKEMLMTCGKTEAEAKLEMLMHGGPTILGLYMVERVAPWSRDCQNLFLLSTFDPQSPLHQSVLLHELVHHAQYASVKLDSPYSDDYEAPAYAAQVWWSLQNGVPEEQIKIFMQAVRFNAQQGIARNLFKQLRDQEEYPNVTLSPQKLHDWTNDGANRLVDFIGQHPEYRSAIDPARA